MHEAVKKKRTSIKAKLLLLFIAAAYKILAKCLLITLPREQSVPQKEQTQK
jgi:hypothetical protein